MAAKKLNLQDDVLLQVEKSLRGLMKPSAGVRGELRATLSFQNEQVQSKAEFVCYDSSGEVFIIPVGPGVAGLLKKAFPKVKSLVKEASSDEYLIQIKVVSDDVSDRSRQKMKSPNQVFESGIARQKQEKKARQEFLRKFGTDDPQILEKQKFGSDLAAKFTGRLLKVGFFGEGHRDYGGMGFWVIDGGKKICYGSICDGQPDKVKKQFASPKEFESWLAKQSNESLSNRNEDDSFLQNNQTVALDRLLAFVS